MPPPAEILFVRVSSESRLAPDDRSLIPTLRAEIRIGPHKFVEVVDAGPDAWSELRRRAEDLRRNLESLPT